MVPYSSISRKTSTAEDTKLAGERKFGGNKIDRIGGALAAA
jgi:hypothetical protein